MSPSWYLSEGVKASVKSENRCVAINPLYFAGYYCFAAGVISWATISHSSMMLFIHYCASDLDMGNRIIGMKCKYLGCSLMDMSSLIRGNSTMLHLVIVAEFYG